MNAKTTSFQSYFSLQNKRYATGFQNKKWLPVHNNHETLHDETITTNQKLFDVQWVAGFWTNEIPQWAELHSRKPQEWNPSEDAWTEIWNLLSTTIENLLQMLHKQQSVICFHTSNILIRWLSSFALYKVKCNSQYICLYEQHKSLLKTSSNWITGLDTHAHKNMFAWPSDLRLNKFSLIYQIFLPLSWFLRFRYLQR